MRSLSLDRTSPVPLYFQVAQHLEQAIDQGELPPGSLLLNEVDFAEALSLSRPTMRRAIQSLADKGLVVRRHSSSQACTTTSCEAARSRPPRS